MKETIFDISTGETIERPYTESEIAKWNDEAKKLQEKQQELSDIAAAKTALLAKLGITEEEAKLLLS